MVLVFHDLDVLLQILEIELLLGSVEFHKVCLDQFQPLCFTLLYSQILLRLNYLARQHFKLTAMIFEYEFVFAFLISYLLDLVFACVNLVIYKLVQLLYFVDEDVALLFVGFLEFAELVHDFSVFFRCMIVEICGNGHLLLNVLHATLDSFYFILNVVLKNFPSSCLFGDLEFDSIEYVYLPAFFEHHLLELLDFLSLLLVLLLQLAYVV